MSVSSLCRLFGYSRQGYWKRSRSVCRDALDECAVVGDEGPAGQSMKEEKPEEVGRNRILPELQGFFGNFSGIFHPTSSRCLCNTLIIRALSKTPLLLGTSGSTQKHLYFCNSLIINYPKTKRWIWGEKQVMLQTGSIRYANNTRQLGKT